MTLLFARYQDTLLVDCFLILKTNGRGMQLKENFKQRSQKQLSIKFVTV